MADPDPIRRVEFATKGGHTKAQNDALRAQLYAEHAAYIKAIDESRPPLSELQRARLAALLLGSRRTPEGAVAS